MMCRRMMFLSLMACCGMSTAFVTPSAPRSSSSALSARRARDLLQSLLEEEQCFSTETGVRAFGNFCAYNVVYEDRFESQPVVGKAVRVRELLMTSIPVCCILLCVSHVVRSPHTHTGRGGTFNDTRHTKEGKRSCSSGQDFRWRPSLRIPVDLGHGPRRRSPGNDLCAIERKGRNSIRE